MGPRPHLVSGPMGPRPHLVSGPMGPRPHRDDLRAAAWRCYLRASLRA
ncbi:Hypothetical protein A7982_04873 [Minicystis rosea]|nr:Hypothetical protein A7982_04873 [Minicystis rosea]